MELIFVFAVVFSKVFMTDFFEVVKIIRAFWIYAFMDNEVFAVFLGNKSIAAMGTAQLYG